MPNIGVVVVDMQQALLAGATPAYRVEAVVEGINRLTAAARAAKAPVWFVQHAHDEMLAPNSPGWQLHPGLVLEDGDLAVGKRVGDSFHETPLQAQLDRQGVEHVVFCGYASEFCVNTAARRAALLGYRTTVVSDLHTTQDKPHLTAQQIVEHQNFVWTNSSLTGNPISVRPLADVLKAEFA
ncbi:isochorismatase family protein [Trinickia terrae]|uniref:Isochorismatase family protein n=1 Tax=Trinickia terrae TaxID=2571161 RepID=A0A4V5PKU3_9BURK|nr:isochorismatase family protein [Trinickia terrae]TKC90870.1 isochorismatase family protein [Trinickia terrae]